MVRLSNHERPPNTSLTKRECSACPEALDERPGCIERDRGALMLRSLAADEPVGEQLRELVHAAAETQVLGRQLGLD